MIDREAIAAEVKKLREQQKLHRGKLAKKARMPGHYIIAKIEKAADEIEVETINRVLGALGSKKLAKDFQSVQIATMASQSAFGPNPYKGLRSYDMSDANVFFGRDAFVELAVDDLSKNNILFFTGPSGVGKSSVVKAGLLPVLETRKDSTVVSFRPGPQPMYSFAATLVKSFPNSKASDVESLSSELRRNTRLLFYNLQAQSDTNSNIVIAIDQFEEIFYPSCNIQHAKDFSKALHNLSTGLNPNEWTLKFILTLRADFFPHLVRDETLNKVVNREKLVSLAAMTDEELRKVIARPAEISKRKISKQLQELVIDDVKSERGSLPLMAFCLHKLWDSDRRPTIGVKTYKQYYGLKDAISKQAESLYQSEDVHGKKS